MGLIKIEGIKLYAYHGHLPEEAVLGGHFIINICLNVDTSLVEKSDMLDDTVDYVSVIEIVKEQMNIRSSMIECPANRIMKKLLLLNRVLNVKVEVEKVLPPINACFDKISVVSEGSN
ncbi:dihydroneopterin aldolase [Flavobacteriales bacterium]|nr:dihydroneopterin aldolase [Flavobacteriales bacterium]